LILFNRENSLKIFFYYYIGEKGSYTKKVASAKLAEIEISCSLSGADQKFPRAKSAKIKSIKDTMI